MDGSTIASKPKRRKRGSRASYRAMLKKQGLNEHHRTPRCKNGGRSIGDLNISKVGIILHRTYHALFGAKSPLGVCRQINGEFCDDSCMLVAVPTRDFSTFHRYFTNRGVLPLDGIASLGVTWGHLFLHGNKDDLVSVFRQGRHYFTKADPEVRDECRWRYLFGEVNMAKMAFELTKYWLPLDAVVLAIPKTAQEEVLEFLFNLSDGKKARPAKQKPPS